MIKVPAEFQVRIIRPQAEETVPRMSVTEIVEIDEPPAKQLLQKIMNGSLIGGVLGLGLYGAMQLCGLNASGLETSIILGIPLLLGILTSYVIF